MRDFTPLAVAILTSLLLGEVATDISSSSTSNLPALRPPPGAAVPAGVEEGLTSVRDHFFAQCRAQGIRDPDKFVEDIQDNAKRCVEENINSTALQQDIEKYSKNGELDELFVSRCRDLPPVILPCMEQRLDELGQCLNETERGKNYTGTLMAALSAAFDFLCFNNGERIAIFLGERGQECAKSNKTGQSVRDCLSAHNLTEAAPDVLANLVYGFSEQNCARLFVAHECLADGLKHCDDPTPANVVDSLLLAFEKPLPCKRKTSAAPPLTAGLGLTQLLLVSVGALLLSWAS